METLRRFSESGGDWGRWVPHSPAEFTPYVATVFMAMILLYAWAPSDSSFKALPAVNDSRPGFSKMAAKRLFLKSGKSLMDAARAQYPRQPYRIITDIGEVAMLPPELAEEIANEPRLNFSKANYIDYHGDIPGFETFSEGFRDDNLSLNVTRKHLTKMLGKLTWPLSEEAAHAASINFGDASEWHTITVKPAVLDMVARMSSRVFLNEALCRNEEWLRVTKDYTVNAFSAAGTLRIYPRWTRRFVHWFLPECAKLRAQTTEARRILTPIVKQRRENRLAALREGRPVPEFNDALDWAEQEAAAKGTTHEPATFQLVLSLVAIHTTTDLLGQAIIDLAQNPEFFQPLREEIAHQLRTGGWKMSSLSNMKLLDSVIKETQRMKPVSLISMRRIVDEDFELSTGLKLKKGMRIHVDSYSLMDPAIHEDPLRWDGYRFLKMRAEPGRANQAELVTVSKDHIAFGYGEHACPGRFFAANEMKVALCHMLMKYEWKLVPGTNAKPISFGMYYGTNSTTQILIRRREDMEVEIDSL